jgi:hypothetical protein
MSLYEGRQAYLRDSTVFQHCTSGVSRIWILEGLVGPEGFEPPTKGL